MNIEALLNVMVEQNASDLHLATGHKPILRVRGELLQVEEFPIVTEDDFQWIIQNMLKPYYRQRYNDDMEVDFAFSFLGKYRFRGAFYHYMDGQAAAFRSIPLAIKPLEQLNLPPVLKTFSRKLSGLVLAVGATGSGKSTTLAAMVDLINRERDCHIITIEDPIEFIHKDNKAYVTQRELNTHTKTFSSALRSALRQDPDVILIGEMRDLETIHLALTAAETGHLVFATLHANSATECIDRIISSFPSEQQSMIRTQLSSSFVGAIFQTLIPAMNKKSLVCACEVLVGTTAVKNLIREEKTYQLVSVMQTGTRDGMRSLDQSLMELQMKKLISLTEVSKRMKTRASVFQTVTTPGTGAQPQTGK